MTSPNRMILVFMATLAGWSGACLAQSPGEAVPLVRATAQTQPTDSGETDAAALLRAGADAWVLATAKLAGLESYGLDGQRRGATPAGEVAAVAVAQDVRFGDRARTVIATIDTTGNFLRLFAAGPDGGLAEVGAQPVALGFAGEGLCLFEHPLDHSLHAFVVGDGGEIQQLLIHARADGQLDARPVRRIQVPSTLKQCAADSRGHVYASEEAVAIWRFNADPEADLGAVIVDTPLRGRLEEEVGGVALYDGGPGRQLLLASDASAGRINAYDRERSGTYLGSFQVGPPGAGEPVGEPGRLFATAAAVGKDYPSGLLLVADDDAANTKLVSMAAVVDALGLPAPAVAPAKASPVPPPAIVRARVETVPANSYGDAADDPAIWANPKDPGASLVVATDKKAGLYLYDMQGRVVQFLADGKMNNVDLREGFPLGGKPVVLVAASNRSDDGISLYRLDTAARRLVDVAAGLQPTGYVDPYGLCMYRSARDGGTYVFVNGDDTGLRQWRLHDAGNGKVRAELVRELAFESQIEGCVADDANGALYVNEEDTALWRLSAEPDGGDARVAIARVDGNPAMKDDLEGIGLYDLGDGRGYLVLSSQGNDTYAVYRREAPQEYLGSFAVVADAGAGIDGISETDGLDVSSLDLGPGFEHGAMVAQDGRNVMPVENQNYKYVSWSDIAAALGLELR